MNIGGDINNRNKNFTLTDAELNNINTSSSVVLYFGGGNLIDIDIINIYDISLLSYIGSQIDIISNRNIIFHQSITTIFNLIDFKKKYYFKI